MLNGHCSKCHKVWTLEKEQGLCHWCGKPATCQDQRAQALRSIKSNRRRKQRQDNHNGNGYQDLEGEWLGYYEIASKFSRKAREEDRGDLLHDIMLTFAEVKRNNGHKPFTEAVMYRTASHLVANYWRAQYRLANGLDCGACGQAQRSRCKEEWLYGDCPRAINFQSLSQPIIDGQGNITELGELISDDKAIDLAEWLDLKTFLNGCPQRLIVIAQKVREGESLTNQEHQYLWRFRQKTQKSLV